MNTQTKFKDLLGGFDAAMLVTSSKEGDLRSRPMTVAGIDSDGDVIFLTEVDSPKVEEILRNPDVNVSCQGKATFLSLSGRARIVTEEAAIKDCWQDSWKAWFPRGAGQDDLALVKVSPEQGEFWDYDAKDQIQFLFEAGKVLIQGEEANYEDVGDNEKVAFG